jgi:glyoxylase-like metal-dependent hydrolase (beta-lactamase superfamily II)
MLYSNYLTIDALRWYFGDKHIIGKARRVLGPEASVPWMPMAETNTLPSWVRAIDNTRLICAADGSALLVDCGSTHILNELKKLRDSGKFSRLDYVFISHYHDDHTDQVPAVVETFGSTVLACRELCHILEHPEAYALPCLTRNPITVSGKLTSGAHWRWKEFDLTAYYFPGQTLYHQALLVRKDQGASILFVGDSFTPTGVDDYCLQNRNFLHPNSGYFRCLSTLQNLPAGCWLVNQHVEPMFRFSPAQLDQMRSTLERRVELLRSLFPWDDLNYGLDESWARLEPYGLEGHAGKPLTCRAVLFNHSPGAGVFSIKPHLPGGWRLNGQVPEHVLIPPQQEGVIEFGVVPGSETRPGLHVITADIASPIGEFRDWAEAMVRIVP